MNKDFFDEYFDDDKDYREDEQPPKQKQKTLTKGFMTALAVCLIAIGAAVWTTISSVSSYLDPPITVHEINETDDDEPTVVSQSEARVNAQVSGVKPDSDSEKDKQVRFNCEPIRNRRVIQGFSEVPVYNETLGDYRAHTGIDYEAEVDDKVRAMGQGVVKEIYCDDLLGNVVVISHSDTVDSYYCGLAKTTLVQAGEVVSAGDYVGTVYAIPSEAAEPAHVHVAVKQNGKWIDPASLFARSNG